MAVWFAHLASYLVGFAGSALLITRVWRERGKPLALSLYPRDRWGILRAVLIVVDGGAGGVVAILCASLISFYDRSVIKKKDRGISVRSGQFEFVKLNTARWEGRDLYHSLLNLNWPQFIGCLFGTYALLNAFCSPRFICWAARAWLKCRRVPSPARFSSASKRWPPLATATCIR